MKFCVIGLGRFGSAVAETLTEHGMEVLAIDQKESIIASISDKVTQAICMPVTDLKSLQAVGVEEVDTAIVGMGKNIEQSVLITALLKKYLKIPMVIARSTNPVHEEILKLVGADKVVFPEGERGVRLANTLSFPFIDIVSITPKFSISQILAPKKFIGKTIKELNLLKTKKVTCFGIRKDKNVELVNENYIILTEDQLLLAGENHNLEEIAKLAAE